MKQSSVTLSVSTYPTDPPTPSGFVIKVNGKVREAYSFAEIKALMDQYQALADQVCSGEAVRRLEQSNVTSEV